ncbi:MAG: helix-turn-helix transcriptional regulator [Cyanobacteria bacterium HKST-UBA06]|nr:helix-turn-helix transcriptional regulator [Cyanobacteria bacterium HKST-UBA04]MCA9808339.1 helix-turn-helix transcriptional regulator [Cyanobacteria bacterium HKST-UBA06]MCA9841147.1 helix-turn-helix transcriptional regulator [Cyanobacteria bacterium HKST-UBA03]
MPERLRLKELVRQKNLGTMKDLCDLVDVDYQTMANWNQGRAFPSLKRTLQLCHVLGCTVEELVEFKTDDEASLMSFQLAAEAGLNRWIRYVQLHQGNPMQWNHLIQLTLHRLI